MLIGTIGCNEKTTCNVYRTDGMEDAAWDASAWIAVADVPVVTGKVMDGTRAADGAN